MEPLSFTLKVNSVAKILIPYIRNRRKRRKVSRQFIAKAEETFGVDSSLVLSELEKPFVLESLFTVPNKRKTFAEYLKDAYSEAPGRAWSLHIEEKVDAFASATNQILLDNDITSVQAVADLVAEKWISIMKKRSKRFQAWTVR